MTTEVDEAFAEWERRSRQTWRRLNYAYSAMFMVAGIAYGFGAAPVLSLPCAFFAGWCFAASKESP